MIKFTIPGKAQPKERPRVPRSGHAYTPAKTRSAEAYIKSLAGGAMKGRKPLTGAVSLSVTIFRAIPKGFGKKKRSLAISGIVLPITRPDKNNQVKLIEDALNGVCWLDDAQVCDSIEKKRYAEIERTEIVVDEIN